MVAQWPSRCFRVRRDIGRYQVRDDGLGLRAAAHHHRHVIETHTHTVALAQVLGDCVVLSNGGRADSVDNVNFHTAIGGLSSLGRSLLADSAGELRNQCSHRVRTRVHGAKADVANVFGCQCTQEHGTVATTEGRGGGVGITERRNTDAAMRESFDESPL